VKYAFAGTPEFAAWVLTNLAGLGTAPAIVISRPDRPSGRGCRLNRPPAVVEGERLGIECIQTDDINDPGLLDRLAAANVRTLVIASFGQMLRTPLLEKILCLNIHTSLLPAYRGAAPIERALAAGETEMGVSIMRVTEGLDEGPWALRQAVSVGLHDDAGSMRRVLGVMGACGMAQVLQGLADGTVRWTPQVGPSTYAHRLTAADCLLDPAKTARAVHDQVRSLRPDIGARAASGAFDVKVWRTWPYGCPGLDEVPEGARDAAGMPGRLVAHAGRLFLGCAEGVAEILEIQPAGRGRMTAAAFLRGYGGRLGPRLEPGVCLPAPGREATETGGRR
jgi:methionyl-tRNA formyltransferase